MAEDAARELPNTDDPAPDRIADRSFGSGKASLAVNPSEPIMS
jgi:hypothetical protein